LAAQKLRQDLYFRLSTVTLHLPPLRERREEIPHLLRHVMEKTALRLDLPLKPFSPKVLEACMRHSWPGNVRELENFVKRYLILDDENVVLADLQTSTGNQLAISIESTDCPRIDKPIDLKSLVRELKMKTEKEAIKVALEHANGNRKEAAYLLSISTKALLQKMRLYGFISAQPQEIIEISNSEMPGTFIGSHM
jgi:two-component system, NtrC family, response regulator AtoC